MYAKNTTITLPYRYKSKFEFDSYIAMEMAKQYSHLKDLVFVLSKANFKSSSSPQLKRT